MGSGGHAQPMQAAVALMVNSETSSTVQMPDYFFPEVPALICVSSASDATDRATELEIASRFARAVSIGRLDERTANRNQHSGFVIFGVAGLCRSAPTGCRYSSSHV